MSIEQQIIGEFVSDIWRLVVGRPILPAPVLPVVGPGWTFACVQITGTWRGTVAVAVDAGLLRGVAAAMGETDPAVALGELASMLAGNLKAILPAPCYLSKPAVGAGDGADVSGVRRRRVLQAGFTDACGEFVVTVSETHKPAVRRRTPERPSGINPLSDSEASGRYPQEMAENYVVVTPAPRGSGATGSDSVR
jgi:chemotaxis protein CheX